MGDRLLLGRLVGSDRSSEARPAHAAGLSSACLTATARFLAWCAAACRAADARADAGSPACFSTVCPTVACRTADTCADAGSPVCLSATACCAAAARADARRPVYLAAACLVAGTGADARRATDATAACGFSATGHATADSGRGCVREPVCRGRGQGRAGGAWRRGWLGAGERVSGGRNACRGKRFRPPGGFGAVGERVA